MNLINEKRRAASLSYLDPNPTGSPTLLLLHGLGADGASWFHQFQDIIAAGIRPLAPDIPGFGMSVHCNGRWTVDKSAVEIVSLLDVLGISVTDVAGLSMGGAVALSLAINFPVRIGRLILVNTFAHLRPGNLPQAIYFLKRFLITMFKGGFDQAEIVAQGVFPEKEQQELRNLLIKNIENTDQRIYRQAMISLGMFDVVNKLATIYCPTLIISGKDDTTVTLRSQLELVYGIREARHVIIEDAGHAVSIDQPARFNNEIIHFLEE